MATWLENQRDKARREKLSRELTHQTFTPPENPIGDYLLSRLRDPLGTIAGEVEKYRAMPISELATEFGSSSGKLAGLIGATKGSSKLKDLWKAVDTKQSPSNTIYSPINKYINNPNYNTGLDVGQQDGLPTRRTYEEIIAKQEAEGALNRSAFESEMQAAIDADARRAAERGNVQPTDSVQNQLSDDEWLAKFQAEGDANKIDINEARGWVRQNAPEYGEGQAMSVPAKTISPFDVERRLYSTRQQNGKWKPVYSDGTPIINAPEFDSGGAATNWLRLNKDKFQPEYQ